MTERKPERRGLGRGLSALLSEVNAPVEQDGPGRPAVPILRLPVESIRPNPDQPRRSFDDTALEELTASIREKGVVQPLIVRVHPTNEGYEIVAGERRWRAAQRAQLHEVPVVVRDYTDQEVIEVAFIENIQRADLNAIDEAAGYRMLIDRFGHTQEKVATVLGKSRSHIANSVRLLSLPEEVLSFVRDGKLTAGHARALVAAPQPAVLARDIIARGLTVRDAEELAKTDRPKPPKRRAGVRREVDTDTRSLEADLSANLRMGVHIRHDPAGGGGRLTVSYRTLEELDLLCRGLSMLRIDLADRCHHPAVSSVRRIELRTRVPLAVVLIRPSRVSSSPRC